LPVCLGALRERYATLQELRDRQRERDESARYGEQRGGRQQERAEASLAAAAAAAAAARYENVQHARPLKKYTGNMTTVHVERMEWLFEITSEYVHA